MGRSSGIGFMAALGLLFIALKLTGAIGWSWLWVLAPFWVAPAVAAAVIVAYGFVKLVRWTNKPRGNRR